MKTSRKSKKRSHRGSKGDSLPATEGGSTEGGHKRKSTRHTDRNAEDGIPTEPGAQEEDDGDDERSEGEVELADIMRELATTSTRKKTSGRKSSKKRRTQPKGNDRGDEKMESPREERARKKGKKERKESQENDEKKETTR